METTGVYALTADGKVAALGPEKAITRLCHWNRVQSGGVHWDMFWVTADKTVDPTAPPYSESPSGPLIAKLFDMLDSTALAPEYHKEMWWCIQSLLSMKKGGHALLKVSRYNIDFTLLDMSDCDFSNLQIVEDIWGHFAYWRNDLLSGDAKQAILVDLVRPSELEGDASLMQPGEAIAMLDLLLGGLPTRPVIKRDASCLHFPGQYSADHYKKVKAEAEVAGLLPVFEKAIADRCIHNYGNKVWYRCTLTPDHAPMSFGWRPEYKDSEDGEWKPMWPGGGGLIYHDYCKDWSTHT